MRLQKLISESGFLSRRKSDEAIFTQRVSVNGKIITSPGHQVDPQKDRIELDGKEIKIKSEKIYLLLNKPENMICTKSDTHNRSTIYDLIPSEFHHLDPAGRLDKDTSGLIILSNDGEFIYQITHPKFELEKEYLVTINGIINEEKIRRLETGVLIENHKTAPAKIQNLKTGNNQSQMTITIHEGKKRQIRLMYEKVGFRIKTLQRIRIGKIKIANLAEKNFRKLTQQEINSLLNVSGPSTNFTGQRP
jgi:pseudouridine synthase